MNKARCLSYTGERLLEATFKLLDTVQENKSEQEIKKQLYIARDVFYDALRLEPSLGKEHPFLELFNREFKNKNWSKCVQVILLLSRRFYIEGTRYDVANADPKMLEKYK